MAELYAKGERVEEEITIRDSIRFGESYVKGMEIFGSQNERSYIRGNVAGYGGYGIHFYMHVDKEEVNTDVSIGKVRYERRPFPGSLGSARRDRKEDGIRAMFIQAEHIHLAKYMQSSPEEFLVRFDFLDVKDPPHEVKVRRSEDGVRFPELFTSQQIAGLNCGENMRISGKKGATFDDAVRGYYILNRLEGGDFVQGERYGFGIEDATKVRPVLRKVLKYREDILRLNGFRDDIAAMRSNEKVIRMIEEVRKRNEEKEGKDKCRF